MPCRAALLVGTTVGALAWIAPGFVFAGDPITQRALSGAEALSLLFVLRIGLGAVSYAAGIPGRLFAPMRVLGSQLVLFFGLLWRLAFPQLNTQPEGFAIIGMAAVFTGVMRAPLTGIALVIEMTESVTMLLPMLGASFVRHAHADPAARSTDLRFLRKHTLRSDFAEAHTGLI